jgi:hypothetical protein
MRRLIEYVDLVIYTLERKLQPARETAGLRWIREKLSNLPVL